MESPRDGYEQPVKSPGVGERQVWDARSSCWRLAIVGLALSAGQAAAGTAVYDFDNTGTINGVAPAAGTPTNFIYVTPITGSNDTGNPNLTGTFNGSPSASISIVTVATANAAGAINPNFAINVLEMPTASILTLTFSSPVSSISFDWALGASPTPGDGDNFVTVAESNGGAAFNTDTLGSQISPAASSGSYSFVASSSAQWFTRIRITSNIDSGTFALDNMDLTPVPEIDPASATGALALLGSAAVMFRGRRKAVRA